MELIPPQQLNDLAAILHLPHISLSTEQAFTMTIENRYHVSLEYNTKNELILLIKFALPDYALPLLEQALTSCSTLRSPNFDFSVAYGKEHLLLLCNLGHASFCTAMQIEQALLNLLNISQKLYQTSLN